VTKIDLVIADEALKEPLKRYVDFKKSHGRTVHEFYVKDKTTDDIKAIISAEYKSTTPPNDTMLVGSIDRIPSFRGDSDNNWTDWRYTMLDDGDLPDLSLGRVPAQSAAELSAWIDKAIARETGPRRIDDILLTAGQDTSLGCPQNVLRVGDNIHAAAETVNLIKKFRTEVETQDVIDAYNASPNVIVYDGHGNRTSMYEIPLSIPFEGLTNKMFPIILDIACKNANWPEDGATERNFAETILLKPGAGAAGIMASGGSGGGHSFFRTIGENMAEARKALATDPRLNEIGRVILLAKVKHGMEEKSYWNYYGDPASSVWESTF
jgi:hypothetical protein